MMRDRCDIPERKYKQIRETLKLPMPTLNATNNFKKKLNETFKIDENKHGYFFEPVQKITYILTNLIERGVIQGKTILLKLAGDGTEITRSHMKIFNFTFSVMNNPEIAYHNFFLGNYIFLKFAFE